MNTSFSFEHDLTTGTDIDAFKSMVKLPTEERKFTSAMAHKVMYQCVGAVTRYAAKVMEASVTTCRVAVMMDPRDGYELVHISPANYKSGVVPEHHKVKTLDAVLLTECVQYLQTELPYEIDLWFKLDGTALKVHFFVTKKPVVIA